MSYPSIGDHGLIGDLQTAALVATDGTIDWFCCPRFDSPSVFAALLDDRRGGRFALAPVTPARTTKQMYLPDTAILVTRYLSESGIAEVLDFMPIDQPTKVSDRRRIVRGVRGEVEFEARVEPRFDYGRRPHQVHVHTAGLPEQVGGARNWDYRFTWVRDASFSVYALLGLGFTDEAAAFGDWLRRRIETEESNGSGPLKIMYRVDGSSDLTEETLDHLDGYRGSRPVRIGNAASDQLQLDIYGEAMNSIHALDSGLLGDWGVGVDGWNHIVGMMDWLCEHWLDPDEGIWETRGGRRRFVYGQLMSWVASDRAI